MKIPLKASPDAAYMPPGHCTKSLLSSLPYYKSTLGTYFHRVRSADSHWKDGKLTHISISFWCGNGGFIGKKGKLYAEIPDKSVACATCEGRAIGAGLDDTRFINGQFVVYSPRL